MIVPDRQNTMDPIELLIYLAVHGWALFAGFQNGRTKSCFWSGLWLAIPGGALLELIKSKANNGGDIASTLLDGGLSVLAFACVGWLIGRVLRRKKE